MRGEFSRIVLCWIVLIHIIVDGDLQRQASRLRTSCLRIVFILYLVAWICGLAIINETYPTNRNKEREKERKWPVNEHVWCGEGVTDVTDWFARIFLARTSPFFPLHFPLSDWSCGWVPERAFERLLILHTWSTNPIIVLSCFHYYRNY